jgi:nitrate reductase gamma subunit
MDNQSTKAKKLQLFDELCNSEITVRYVYYSILINYFSFLNRKIFQKQIRCLSIQQEYFLLIMMIFIMYVISEFLVD